MYVLICGITVDSIAKTALTAFALERRHESQINLVWVIPIIFITAEVAILDLQARSLAYILHRIIDVRNARL